MGVEVLVNFIIVFITRLGVKATHPGGLSPFLGARGVVFLLSTVISWGIQRDRVRHSPCNAVLGLTYLEKLLGCLGC